MDINWIAISAIGQILIAIFTFGAIIVALHVAYLSLKDIIKINLRIEYESNNRNKVYNAYVVNLNSNRNIRIEKAGIEFKFLFFIINSYDLSSISYPCITDYKYKFALFDTLAVISTNEKLCKRKFFFYIINSRGKKYIKKSKYSINQLYPSKNS